MKHQRLWACVPMLFVALATMVFPTLAFATSSSYIGQFHTISTIASTVPANGDVDPYGVAVVPRTLGRSHPGKYPGE